MEAIATLTILTVVSAVPSAGVSAATALALGDLSTPARDSLGTCHE
jgi:hypothetical protein